MAELARTPDFLHRHVRLVHRVRNLETGVHPTLSDVDYFNSTLWAPVPLEPGFQPWISGVDTFALTWRVRVGIVTLAGGVSNDGGISSPWPAGDEVKVATMPPGGRPTTEMAFMAMNVYSDVNPLIPVAIKTNGDVVVRDTAGALQTGSREGVRFDGISYIPGAISG